MAQFSRATSLWIQIGAALFIVALAVSAVVVPPLRALHVLQSLIYAAVAIFSARGSIWALGAGITIASLWNGLQLFITHNMQRGAILFWSFLRTGHARQLDTMMVALGGLAHFILIAACISAFLNRYRTHRSWWKLLGGGLIVLAYFGLIVAIALPRQ